MTSMPRRRILVQLPDDVAQGIEKLVGPRQRATFVAELLRRELKRRQQLAALNAAAGTWKDEDHPELAEGGAAYVEKL
jgi:metal-responsive CopG/Arc/MetJ family transcriptional regulator